MRAGAVNTDPADESTARPLGTVTQPELRLVGGNETALAAHPVITHRLQVTQRRQDLLLQAKRRLDQ